MKTEFLKSLNLSQEVIDKIMAENGKDIATEQKNADKIIQERDSYKMEKLLDWMSSLLRLRQIMIICLKAMSRHQSL